MNKIYKMIKKKFNKNKQNVFYLLKKVKCNLLTS